MPTCRRKRVVLTEPSQALLDAANVHANKHVYYLAQTGEIFETYEDYAARMSFYRLKQFQCEVTGKSGLSYFDALESELNEARTMHSRFPEPLKPAILAAVQWQVMGRLDHLVDAVYERFKDRYFPEERVLVDIQGDKYFARIAGAFPPQTDANGVEAKPSPSASSETGTPPPPQPNRLPLHKIGGDLKIPTADAMARDDPAKYLYQIQIIDEERSSDSKLSVKDRETRESNRARWSTSLMEVACGVLSRDRLAFSKSILRRFIRDCVDRDAAVASPWIVKPAIAERFGVSSVMPEETRKGVENIKRGEIEKRKKVWEDKEGPPTKKQKKMEEQKAEALALAAEIRERDRDKEESAEAAAAAEKKKKKPLRYPTEDLDVKLSEKEIKAGAMLKRPVPSRTALPFGEDQKTFESFLMVWNFLIAYGQPLHLSCFTLDEFEHALKHSVLDPPCGLLAEVHSSLIYNLRTVPFTRHSAVMSLLRQKQTLANGTSKEDPGGLGVSIDQLAAAMADVGNNWERQPLRHGEGRDGWQDALIGCLKDHADVDKFPRMRTIFTRLLFAPDEETMPAMPAASPSTSRQPSPVLSVVNTPAQRYHTLPPEDKIATLAFMCNLAVSSKTVHSHMESCEEQLTALRKEKIEVNRQKKQYAEEMNGLLDEAAEDDKANGVAEKVVVPESSDLSDPSDAETETGSANGNTNGTKPKDLRKKIQTGGHAKQRQAARAKVASTKQAMAEHRRLDEEMAKLDRRLEGIEREFRKLLGVVRVRPLGKDRFHNRIWWFDGLGSASLIGSGGAILYGTGRIFVQGPSEFDMELLEKRQRIEKNVISRRQEEEGEEGMLGVGEWAVYEDLEQVTEFLAWLSPKGVREVAIKNAFTKWWPHIGPGMRRRATDLEVHAKLPDARRSARTKVSSEVAREPYMLWTNRRAVTGN